MQRFVLLLLAVAVAFPFGAERILGAEQDGRRTMRYQSTTREGAVVWQETVRSRLFGLLKMTDLISLDQPIPLAPKIVSASERPEYTMYEVEITSTPGRRIPLVLTVPANREGPLPAVVVLAGHGGTRHTAYGAERGYYRMGELLAESGYVTISTSVGQHAVAEEGRTLMGERLWDLMRCIDYLESRNEIDPNRIGAAGKSLGGEMVMWLGAMDQRVAGAVVIGFLTDMDQMESNHCMCWKLAGLRELVDFADIYALIAPRTLMFQNGIDEPPSQFPPSVAVRVMAEITPVYRDFGVPQEVSLVVHSGGHEVHIPSVTAFFSLTFSPE
jgi:acetyl esterase/lipase